MILNRKIEILFEKDVQFILDGQSKICNWLYNQLLDRVNEEYKHMQKEATLLRGRNLRNMVPQLKREHPFLNSVYSSPLKNVAFRLVHAFDGFLKLNRGYPNFKSIKVRWFSLYYDEPSKGYKLNGKKLLLSLGKDRNHKQIRVTGTLSEPLHVKATDQIKNFRLCKQHHKYYGIFCIERVEIEKKQGNRWLAIDPNHKNFFVGINHKGESIEFEKLSQPKYFDMKIDELKSKRDKCKKHSKRRKRLNKTLDRLYHRRREQIKSLCYTIANNLAKEYDCVMIGDYTPTIKNSTEKSMHRSMLNQSIIGKFRNTLEWVMLRSGKEYRTINEYNTTKTCCICDHQEKKEPMIREFICSNCQHHIHRDINSSVNIAIKGNLLSGSDYVDWELSRITYTVRWNYRQSRISFTGYATQKVA